MKYRLDIPVDGSPACHHTLQITLEQMLIAEPQELVLAFGSRGPMDPHSALSYVRLLSTRNPAKTKIVTLARGGLYDTELLVWLIGDERDLPGDSWLFIRQPHSQEMGATSEFNPVAMLDGSLVVPDFGVTLDHASVLKKLDEYVPVSELRGRPIKGKELEELALCGATARAMDSLLASLTTGISSGGLGRLK